MITISSNDPIEIMERVEAMAAKEDATRCYNYFKQSACNIIDVNCRKSMVSWCQQVGKALSIKPQTSWIAISFFDRYLSSGRGKSQLALQDRYKFQLSAITSFYIAVKMHETVQLNVVTLAKLCRGYYAEKDILNMEEDILFALDWRVHTPTPLDFVVHLIELLPKTIRSSVSDSLLQASQKLLDQTMTDLYFTFCKPSVIGASCLSSALTYIDALSSSQRQAFYLQLASITDLIDVMEAQSKLLKANPISMPSTVSKATKPCAPSKPVATVTSFKSKTFTPSGNSSPICVTEATQQA